MKVLERSSLHARLEASVNGNRRCAVQVFLRDGDQESLVTVDEVNLSSSRDRAALAAQVPEAHRDEVLTLAREFASDVVGLQLSEKGSGDKEKTPFAQLEPWEESVDGATVLNDLAALIERYMVLPKYAASPLALWIVHTYAIAACDYSPYLHVSSPTRECGKSTLLDLLFNTAFRAQLTSGITAAALYRTVEKWAPTMLLDELDNRLKGENAEGIRAVLCSGFSRATGVSTICVGKEHEVRDFKTFCPKVLAGIGRLPDTITSRSIPIRLARASKDELRALKKIQGHKIAAICEPYRRRAMRWAIDNLEELRESEPSVPDALGARQADVWRPLLAIADLVGGEWPDRARRAAVALHGVQEEESDYGLLILADIRTIFKDTGEERLSTARIAEELGKRVDRPWSEYRFDKPISPTGVAKILSRFDLKAVPVRIGMETKRGYKLEDFAPLFKKYVPLIDEIQVAPEDRGEAWEPPE